MFHRVVSPFIDVLSKPVSGADSVISFCIGLNLGWAASPHSPNNMHSLVVRYAPASLILWKANILKNIQKMCIKKNGIFGCSFSFFSIQQFFLLVVVLMVQSFIFQVYYKKQELLTLGEHLGSSPVFGEICATHLFSFLCCVVFVCFVYLRPLSWLPNVVSLLSILHCTFCFL